MSARHLPSVEHLRQCLREENGHIFWLWRPRSHFPNDQHWHRVNTRYSGKEAGGLCEDKKRKKSGWSVHFGECGSVKRSHVVWAIHTGAWPASQIDHKNRNSLDDRFDNLRPASNSQNSANAKLKATNETGFKGVGFHKQTRKWRARIRVNRHLMHLGLFVSPEEAHAAYCEAAKRYFGEFACDGTSALTS